MIIRHLLILAILILSGCSERAGDTNPKPVASDVPPALRRPNVGSSYTFVISFLDSTGAIIDSSRSRASDSGDAVAEDGAVGDSAFPNPAVAGAKGGSTVDTIRVVAVNGSFAGVDDVTAFLQGSDTSYVHYESNGDLSLATPDPVRVDGGWIWVRFPMSGSKRPDTASRLDTVIEKTPVRIVLVSTYDGEEKMAVGGKVYHVKRARIAFHTVFHLDKGEILGGVETTLWFAPELGFIVRKEERGIGSDAYGTERGSVMKLRSFSLK